MKYLIFLLLLCVAKLSFSQSDEIKSVFQTGHNAKINKIEFHPDNQHLVSCSDDGRLIVWDILLGMQRSSVFADKSGIKTFNFFNDSTILSLSYDGEVEAWKFPSLKFISKLNLPSKSIQDFAVLKDSTLCLVDKNIYLFNWSTNSTEILNEYSNDTYSSVSYNSATNDIAISGALDNYCTIISLDKPIEFQNFILGKIEKLKYKDSISLTLINSEGNLIEYSTEDNKKLNYTLRDNQNRINDVSKSSKFTAVASQFGFSKILYSESFEEYLTIGVNGVALTSIHYSIDEKWLAISNTKGEIHLYETEGYRLNRILKGLSANVSDVLSYKNQLFIGYSDGVLRSFELSTNKITSNSIKSGVYDEQQGIEYSILSIDSIWNRVVYFKTLKIDRHHAQTSILKSAKKLQGTWDLNRNEIVLQKEIKDKKLDELVNYNFDNKIPYRFADYSFRIGEDQLRRLNSNLFFENRFPNQQKPFEDKDLAPLIGFEYLATADSTLITYAEDGSLRFWSKKGEYLASLYLSGQYGFTYINDKNQYFSSKSMLDKIGFLYKENLYSYQQFDLVYNRPDELIKKLPFYTNKDIVEYKLAYEKRLSKLGAKTLDLTISKDLPSIEVNYLNEYSTTQQDVKFEISCNSKNSEIKSYTYIINGIETEVPINEKLSKQKLEIKLTHGINQVEFFCVDVNNLKSLVKKINITCEADFASPNLFVVSIGLSEYQDSTQNLVYAEKDATEINNLLAISKKYNSIYQKTYYNSEFNSQSLSEINTFLSVAEPNDVVVLYYAGHGVLDSKLDYYLSTYSMDFSKPEQQGCLFSDVELLFENLTCRNKLILIDACYSGEVDEDIVIDSTRLTPSEQGDIQFRGTSSLVNAEGGELGIYELAKMTFADMSKSRGTNILSSASGLEYALESKEWKNGLFTYALKKALLDNEADLNGDKLIQIMELQVYLRETVSILSNGKQNPILRKENSKNNFIVW